MAFEKIADFRPDGHAFFIDARNRLTIADSSGKTPDETDDGVLYIKGNSIYADSNGLYVRTACSSIVMLNNESAEFLIRNEGFSLLLGPRGAKRNED
jgi:hypothetical protein